MRILGIDLSDTGTILCFYGEEGSLNIPTVILKEKGRNSWRIGEDAYEALLVGNGSLTDKLLSFTIKSGITTIDDKKYNSSDLLKNFFKLSIDKILQLHEGEYPEEIVVSIPTIDKKTVETIITCFLNLGYKEGHVHVISRAESFIYYCLSQRKEMRTSHVGLFSLYDLDLTYYELKLQQKSKNPIVFAEQQKMDESLSLDVINTPSGAKIADKVLTSMAERILKNKIFSSIILTGKGFESIDWAPEFMKMICTRRKVFVDEELFARGASFRGSDYAGVNKLFQFVCICEGRIDSSVYIDTVKDVRSLAYPISSIGDTWYDKNSVIRLIPYNVKDLELTVIPMDLTKRKSIHIPLDFLPKRPPRTTMIDVIASFSNDHTLSITIKDAGFGEIFPAGNASHTEEVSLWD